MLLAQIERFELERETGSNPRLPAWKAGTLPRSQVLPGRTLLYRYDIMLPTQNSEEPKEMINWFGIMLGHI